MESIGGNIPDLAQAFVDELDQKAMKTPAAAGKQSSPMSLKPEYTSVNTSQQSPASAASVQLAGSPASTVPGNHPFPRSPASATLQGLDMPPQNGAVSPQHLLPHPSTTMMGQRHPKGPGTSFPAKQPQRQQRPLVTGSAAAAMSMGHPTLDSRSTFNARPIGNMSLSFAPGMPTLPIAGKTSPPMTQHDLTDQIALAPTAAAAAAQVSMLNHSPSLVSAASTLFPPSLDNMNPSDPLALGVDQTCQIPFLPAHASTTASPHGVGISPSRMRFSSVSSSSCFGSSLYGMQQVSTPSEPFHSHIVTHVPGDHGIYNAFDDGSSIGSSTCPYSEPDVIARSLPPTPSPSTSRRRGKKSRPHPRPTPVKNVVLRPQLVNPKHKGT